MCNPNIYCILKTLLTMSLSTATTERSFSLFEICKEIYLLSTKGQEILSALALLLAYVQIHSASIGCSCRQTEEDQGQETVDRHRHRSRSRSPRRRSPRRERERHRSRSISPRPRDRHEKDRHEPQSSRPPREPQAPRVTDKELNEMSEEEQQMAKLMGFASFDTTKNKKVEGNDVYVAYIPKKRRYRQYMNRRGGFNRPLDFIA